MLGPTFKNVRSSMRATLALRLEDEAQCPRVGQGRGKQQLAAWAQGFWLAAGELAAVNLEAKGSKTR